ncbi:MAG: peptidoglycan editing factor PgeF [Brevefilum sp.]
MGFHHQHGLRYYQFDLFNNLPIFHAVLTRKGGVSKPPFHSLNTGGTVGDDSDAVLENHRRIYEALGYPFDSRFDVWQVHGTQILAADRPRPVGSPHLKADGILTDKPGITLFMRFADCVPILLYDPQNQVIGIAHSGWKGTCQKIAAAAIEKMHEQYGSKATDILAAIGPSICSSCYEVGDEIYRAFQDTFTCKTDQFFQRKNNTWYLDLWRANQYILHDAGVTQLEIAEICTACHHDDWYSHRAEGAKTGRFGVLMALKE